jgi:hypothetical protein
MQFLVSLLSLLWLNVASATTIAIIDTGFDLDHDFLKPKILKHESDEDAINTHLKQFSDWNFHDNHHLKEPVIKDQSLLQEIFLYRNLRAKKHQDGLSVAELEWFQRRDNDKKFIEQVRKFKKHSHGTFVAGIALREGENIKIFPLRGIQAPKSVNPVETKELSNKNPEEQFADDVIRSQNRVITKFSKICLYLSMNNINIVNASYGISHKSITTKFREKYKEYTGLEIQEQRLRSAVHEYFQNILKRSSEIIQKYPRMLFVFSAGNSGQDNDLSPHYPSKIKLPNTLSVAAMNGDYLASFSNFGKIHVDVGAPGVAILSFVPKVYSQDGQNLYSPSSGTSMAAPYISNTAAQILNINPLLSPHEIKQIILETGDAKEHLKMNLVSSSMVNNETAIKAALLTKTMPLAASIELARSGLIPMEDSISFGHPLAVEAELLKNKVLDSIPKDISAQEVEEIQVTSEESSLPQELKINTPDNLIPLPSVAPSVQKLDVDPIPANQNREQFPQPSEAQGSSSSQVSPLLHQNPTSVHVPSSP